MGQRGENNGFWRFLITLQHAEAIEPGKTTRRLLVLIPMTVLYYTCFQVTLQRRVIRHTQHCELFGESTHGAALDVYYPKNEAVLIVLIQDPTLQCNINILMLCYNRDKLSRSVAVLLGTPMNFDGVECIFKKTYRLQIRVKLKHLAVLEEFFR